MKRTLPLIASLLVLGSTPKVFAVQTIYADNFQSYPAANPAPNPLTNGPAGGQWFFVDPTPTGLVAGEHRIYDAPTGGAGLNSRCWACNVNDGRLTNAITITNLPAGSNVATFVLRWLAATDTVTTNRDVTLQYQVGSSAGALAFVSGQNGDASQTLTALGGYVIAKAGTYGKGANRQFQLVFTGTDLSLGDKILLSCTRVTNALAAGAVALLDDVSLAVSLGSLGIAQQPVSVNTNIGANVTFSAVITNGVDSYQWYKDSSPIPGATASSYTMNSVLPADAGSFVLYATNEFGFVSTAPASLVVQVINPIIQAASGVLTLEHARVIFNQQILPETATNLANYSFQGGALMVSNVMQINSTTVELYTSPMTPGASYTVLATGIAGLAGNTNAGTSSATFNAPALVVSAARYDAGTTATRPTGPPNPETTDGGYWYHPPQTTAFLESAPVQDDINGSTGLPTGLNAWQVTDFTAASSQFYWYELPVSEPSKELVRTNGWRLKARVRMVDDNFGSTTCNVQYADPGLGRLFVMFFDHDTTDNLTVLLQGTGGATHTLTTDGTGADYHDHVLIYEPGIGASYYFDGRLIQSGYQGNTALSGGNGLRFGTQSSGGQGQANLNLVQFDAIGATQPTVTLQPQGAIKGMGQTATFTAGFSPFVAGYQWLSNGVPIPGARTTSYTTPILTPDMDGQQYRCLALHALGNVQTTAASLTVLTDTNPPTVVNASISVFGSRVRLRYSLLMESGSTASPVNYTFLDDTLSVFSATMVDLTTVDLSVYPQPAANSNYVLRITGPTSLAGTAIAPGTQVPLATVGDYPAPNYLIAAFGPESITDSDLGGATWKDLSGNGNDAINPLTTTNRRPTRASDRLNGHDTLSFDPDAFQYLYINGATSLGFDQYEYTWFAVVRATNVAGSSTPNIIRHQAAPGGNTGLDAHWGSFLATDRPAIANGGPFLAANGRLGSGGTVESYAFPLSNAQWYIIAGHVDFMQSFSLLYDPATQTSVGGTNLNALVLVTTPKETWIGATATGTTGTNAGSGWFGGEMAEMLLYTGPLTDTDMTNIQQYLETKYFPPIPQLSVSRPGADVRIEFTGVLQSATNAAGPYLDLPGAPTSPYVIPPGSQLQHQFFRARGQ